jgi:hypothetical protein
MIEDTVLTSKPAGDQPESRGRTDLASSGSVPALHNMEYHAALYHVPRRTRKEEGPTGRWGRLTARCIPCSYPDRSVPG